ncbi:MAG TPA: twitch domain-containing radical SAM protein [Burkholderiaceae bacterium]|nr:twitch domain-containing radical SAM protein [Burkholderiaceae bacterium]
MENNVEIANELNKKTTEDNSFCIYPFKAINVMPNGNVHPCCAFAKPIEKNSREMSVYEYPFREIWDSEFMREIRKDMIEGNEVKGCTYCYEQEQQGLSSMRVEANKSWENGYLNDEHDTIDQLKSRVKAANFRISEGPENLDLDMGNLCNLKCRMCNATYSSGLATDSTHSRWMPTGTIARWQGRYSIIAPKRIWGITYKGFSEPEQASVNRTTWTDGNATILLPKARAELIGFAVKLSAEKPDNHSLKITLNNKILFEGLLTEGAWEKTFYTDIPANEEFVELRFQSSVFKRPSSNTVVGVGIDEIKLIRSDIGRSEVTFSRITSGKQWFQDLNFLVSELVANPKSIKRLNVIGGEPLLIKELRDLMRHLINVGVAKQINLVISTNGMYADDEWFELATNFRHNLVGISIDGFDKVNEYIRHQSNWKTISSNLCKFSIQANTYLYISYTVQTYNIFDIVNVVDFCIKNNIIFKYHFLTYPKFLDVYILPKDLRQKAADKIKEYISQKFPLIKENSTSINESEIILNLNQLIFALESNKDSDNIQALDDFIKFTNDIDLSRGQNINHTIPELVEGLSKSGVNWVADTKYFTKNISESSISLPNSNNNVVRLIENNTNTIFKHKYEYTVHIDSGSAASSVIKMVGQNKYVLDVGCGPGSITKILSEQSNCKVIGLEFDSEAIEKVSPYCVKVLKADLNSDDWPDLLANLNRFDVVVAADVLEHLLDPLRALKAMVPLLSSTGTIVVSMPHIGHAAVLSCLFHGDFKYGSWGLLDNTHIRFFGLKNIENLFKDAGLKIIEVQFITKLPSETEFSDIWSKLTPTIQDTLMLSEHALVYQVIIRAVPLGRTGDSVPLQPPSFTYEPQIKHIEELHFKSKIGMFFTTETKKKIRRVLDKLGFNI